ncbi:MAG: ATP synthase F0 subunit B, partial [Oscillospiraceae bacterium]|nr:ATP synthase F0 subunit B [Oscillospiraceae bacterium]
MDYMSFFTIDVWTMIFTWVNMIILYNVMKKLLFKPVMNILNQREAEIQKIYDDANEANEKAVNLEKEYSEKMAQARDEAGEIIKQATLSAQRREQEIISQAQEKAAIMTKRAEAEIAQERKKA